MTVNEVTVEANGVEFHCLESGSGPLALCLHGFPDTAHTWDTFLPVLADAGFHAVAPFMRGYSPTGPAADGRYQAGVLAQDACALHDALGGGDPGVIIGHDWGAAATYGAACHEPDRWRRVVTMAVPPKRDVEAIFSDYRQIRRASYVFIFQSPMAEIIVRQNDWAFIEGLRSDWSPRYDSSGDLAAVRDALSPPGCLTAALGYYRQALQVELQDPALAGWQESTVDVPPQPTLYCHGRAAGIGAEFTEPIASLLSEGSRVESIDHAGHFVHLEAAGHILPIMIDFVSS